MNALRFALSLAGLMLFVGCILTALVGGAMVAFGVTDVTTLSRFLGWLFPAFLFVLLLRGALIWLQRRRGQA
jgi:hypothetical protein